MPSTALPLDQQLVIVTGASRGLGAAIARAFLREGARVVVNYLNSEAAARELAATAPTAPWPRGPTCATPTRWPPWWRAPASTSVCRSAR